MSSMQSASDCRSEHSRGRRGRPPRLVLPARGGTHESREVQTSSDYSHNIRAALGAMTRVANAHCVFRPWHHFRSGRLDTIMPKALILVYVAPTGEKERSLAGYEPSSSPTSYPAQHPTDQTNQSPRSRPPRTPCAHTARSADPASPASAS